MKYVIHKRNTLGVQPLKMLRKGLNPPVSLLLFIITLPFKLLPGRLMRRLSKTQRLFINMVLASIMLVFGVWIASGLLNPTQTEAAWFNSSWSYRKIASVTSSSTLTNYQVKLTIDTATLITAGKMKSDCTDLRLTDAGGHLLPYWIETGAAGCNTATTSVWTKMVSVPSSGSIVYVYYGNPQATNVQNGDKVFELFDDFSGNLLNPVKWTTGTIGATSGTDFTVAGGLLTGGNSNRTITSVKSFTGDYSAEARTYTTTPVVNGFTPVGFWASTSNGWALLDHNGTSYYRNDATWVNFGFSGNTQWTRNTAKVAGTTGTYARVGETSGSVTSTGTNSGISGENIRLSARSDNSATNQSYAANWDWIIVRKAASSEPTASFGSEEQSPGPVAYWKFDEGTGTVASSSGSSSLPANLYNASWQPSDQCIWGKCLSFNGSTTYADLGLHTVGPRIHGAPATTLSFWVNFKGTPTAGNTYQIFAITNSTGGSVDSKFDENRKITVGGRSTSGDSFQNAVSTNALSLNTWHHVVGILDYPNDQIRIYINGILDKTQSVTFGSNTYADSANGTLNDTIGNFEATSRYLKGSLDEVKLYPFAQSITQIQSDFISRGSSRGSGAVLGASNQSNLSNGLVGHWKMDEASWNGTNDEVIDSSNNGNDGTAVLGTEASPSAKFGNSGYFAGNDEAISIPDSTSLDLGDNLTISLWAKRGAISVNNYIMQKGAGPYAIGFNASNQLYLDMPGTGNIFTSTAAFTDTSSFHHIVFAKKGSSLYVYYDGISVPGTFNNRTLTDNSSALYLGSNSGNTSTRYPGNMDEVRLYNRQLSPAEILQLYTFTPGPVGYWNFEEGTGSSVNDSSGYGNNGTWNGTAPYWTQGKFGKGGNFNGSNDYVTTGTNASINAIAGAITVEAWVYPKTTSGIRYYMSNASDVGSVSGYGLRSNYNCASSFEFQIRDSTNTARTANACGVLTQANKWYHVVGTFDGTTVRIIINGVVAGSTNYTGTMAAPASNTATIGRLASSSNYYTNGTIDEVKIYNYARTTGQIISDMNANHPLGGSPVGSQLGYWKFDEGNSTTTFDSSPQRVNGTITGANYTNNGKFGKALYFNGASYDTLGNIAAYKTANKTISFWANPTVSPGGTVIIFGNGGANYYVGMTTSNRLFASHSITAGTQQTTASSNNAVTINEWHYYAVSWTVVDSNVTVTMYKDGGQISSTAYTTGYSSTYGSNFMIGALTSGANFYTGYLDEIKIYSEPLSTAEIKVDFNRGSSLSMGALGTSSSDSKTASNSATTAYCVPGDTATCSAPTGEWRFDEKNGTTANDTSGNSRTGTLTSGPSWTQGKVGTALLFDGSDDYVSTTNGVDISSGDWTMQAWIYPTAYGAQWRHVFGAEAQTFAFGIASGSLDVTNVSVADCTVSTITPPLNAWSHIAATFVDSSNSLTYYVNGNKANTVTCNVTPTAGRKTQYLGRTLSYTSAFQGKIDEPRIYNYVRTHAQVVYDYNRGKPVAWYKIDECQGSTINDSSGSGNAGTITIGGSGTQTSAGTCQTASTAWGNGATGKFNSSLNFDGTDDYFTIAQPNIPTSPNAFTVSGYIKPTTQDGFIITPNSNGIDQWIGYDVDAQRLWVSVATSGDTNVASYYSTSNSVPTSTWTHFAVSVNNRDVKIYINGKLNNSATHGFDIGGWTSTWYVGQRGNSTFWYSGQLDDLQVFNYPLTLTQIKNILNQNSSVRFGPNTGTP